jgi:hypothetical protein
MLSEADLITIANTYLDAYRGVLVIDPVLRFSVRVSNSGPPSQLVKDPESKLSWFMNMNASAHHSIEDVRDSAIDFLSEIMLADMDLLDHKLVSEVKERISCRLFCALKNVLPDLPEDE